MGKKNKQKRIADISRFPNVFQYHHFKENPELKGRWNKFIFENNNPITLELACGKGEYSVTLGQRNPGRNYIGVDIKGPRIWVGAKQALEKRIDNVRFLRTFIDHLDHFFGENEVDEIWILFPDPYLRKERKRLTSPKFLDIYRKVMKPGGRVHLKTDSGVLFDYTVNIIKQENCEITDLVQDVYLERQDDDILNIQTYYEKMHLEKGKTIRYVSFRL